jgi:hypothetical protein
MTAKPDLAQVRDLVATMIEQSSRCWIGEGEEIAQEVLAYIDGHSPDALTEWKRGMDDWTYLYAESPPQMRGPFKSRQDALDMLARLPERATSPSPFGPTADRDSYVVLTRDEYKQIGDC